MTYNEKGLFCVKPTTFSAMPDQHACSFNRIIEVRIENESGEIILNEFDIEKLNQFMSENK